MRRITRVPMPLNIRLTDYNNNNEHDYTPYIIRDDKLVIDSDWWNSLTLFAQKLIIKSLNEIPIFDKINVPHEYQNDDRLILVYRSYIESFDYHIWYSDTIPNGPKDVTICQITDEMKDILCPGRDRLGHIDNNNIECEHYKLSDNQKFSLINLKNSIQKVLDKNIGQKYFIRLSATSGKNEKPVRPFSDADDIIEHIISVKLFHEQEYARNKDTYLIMIPWNDVIDPRCEFRIFVVNRKLTAASPQKWFELNQYSIEELEAFENALSNIKFIDTCPYETFVADVYIDVNTEICHLIELNPFGAHSGAGASFFNWIDDFDQLHGLTNRIELRYLSIINY